MQIPYSIRDAHPLPLPARAPELLAPAGNFEKLEIALHFGADAVYLAGKDFSLRNYSGNFTDDELFEAVQLAHSKQVSVYLACNIYSRNSEEARIREYLENIRHIGPDALIVADPGILRMCRQILPDMTLHLSTQANTTNLQTARFWQEAGVGRVNLARELSLAEVTEIARHSGLETEVFIHGAMCISYSGRCLLSTFLNNRDSNRGLCSHPCRWRYALMEEKRPGQFYPVSEDPEGTYIFNSKDLCMIDHIPELIHAGVTALKIEGRMKGIHYLATVVRTYREAIDRFMAEPETYQVSPAWRRDLSRVFQRPSGTGFFFGTPEEITPNYQDSRKGQVHGFIGKILSCGPDGCHRVGIRNRIHQSDRVEVLSPGKRATASPILALTDLDGIPVEYAQPNTDALLTLPHVYRINDIIRKI